MEGGSSGAGGEGPSGGGDGGIDLTPPNCDVSAVSHDACEPASGCPIDEDYEISCDNRYFGQLGLQVAKSSDGLFMGAASWENLIVWSFDGESGTELQNFPLDQDDSPLAFAVDASSTLYVLGDESVYDFQTQHASGGLSLVTVAGEQIEESLLGDADGPYLSFYDLALDPDGVPHVWFVSGSPDEQSVATPNGDGSWSREVVEHPGIDWERFTLSDSGELVSFGLATPDDFSYQLVARLRGADQNLGSPVRTVGSSGAPRYRPLDPPVPLEQATMLRYAAVVQHPDHIEVAWATDEATGMAALPGTAEPEYQCSAGPAASDGSPCPEPCNETAAGLEHEAFAATRTADDIWVAYAIQHADWDVEYMLQEIDLFPVCVGHVVEDRTTAELLVVRVPLGGGQPSQVLSLPVGGLGLPASSRPDSGPIAIHAFADAIAVAVRMETMNGSGFRVLTLNAR